jgi:DNA-binding beta-propeller fold protein YncE
MTDLRHACAAAAVVVLGLASGPAGAQLMIVGNDEKITFDDSGKAISHEPGRDTVSIVDLSKPEAPRVAATFALANTIVGPPTNLAIHPSGEFALIANSVNPQKEGDTWKNVPDDKVFVIDLKANPPKAIATVNAGKQPSGMAINSKGDMALVANRADGTVSVLSIKGKEDTAVDTVNVGSAADSVSGVAITPDGKRAFAVKSAANKIALLAIDGEKVTYDKRDLPTGVYPYNIVVAPNGRIAIAVNNGAGGGSDGNVDTASVIDLEADPPRVIDHIVIGDAPEGLAISPKGDLAMAVLLRGSNIDKKAFYYNPTGSVVALKIDGKKVTKTGEVTVGALPEGVAFSPKGDYLYVGNFIDQDMSVLKVDGDKLTDAGRVKLPGHPASMRSGPQ